jgi:hypothetical protein
VHPSLNLFVLCFLFSIIFSSLFWAQIHFAITVTGSQVLCNIGRLEGAEKHANPRCDDASMSLCIVLENNQRKSMIVFLNAGNDRNAMNSGRVCFVVYNT